MRFYEYGDPAYPAVVLIHGMLTPYTIWRPILPALSKHYRVIVPALGGHDGDPSGEFVSAEAEADTIAAYLHAHECGVVHAVIGLSLGGVIAFCLWRSGSVDIAHLLLDGAPLAGFGTLLREGMTANYLSIVKKSKERDAKTLENFKKQFLPAQYLDDYLAFIDTMSPASVKAAVAAASVDRLKETLPDTATRLHYFHGTKINEHSSQKTARRLSSLYSAVDIHCFDGKAHGELLIYEPRRWMEETTSCFI